MQLLSSLFAIDALVHGVKAAAVEGPLRVQPGGVVGELPALLREGEFLLLIHGQAGAGDAELEDEDDEQDDHVEEEQDLDKANRRNRTLA